MPTPDPWQFWTAQQIADASDCPLSAIKDHWPRVVSQLVLCGLNDRPTQMAAIGTIAIESASTFAPVREAYYLGEPEPAESYRKGLSYYPWYGRGLIQLTWQSNYKAYGQAVNDLWKASGVIDLIARPDDALDPDVSAAILACYFRDHATVQGYSIPQAARAGDWEWVRRLVQGGTAGLDRLVAVVMALGGTQPATITYNPAQPPERQVQDWVCSIRTLTWMLKSLGLAVDAGSLQDEMVPGYVTPSLGLLDGRGYGLAEVARKHLPASTTVDIVEGIAWDDLHARAGNGPIGIGSASLYHWIAVSGIADTDNLNAPNPAPNYPAAGPIGDTLSRAEFDRWAPWNAVHIVVPQDQPAPAPVDELAQLRAEVASLRSTLGYVAGDVADALAVCEQQLFASAGKAQNGLLAIQKASKAKAIATAMPATFAATNEVQTTAQHGIEPIIETLRRMKGA